MNMQRSYFSRDPDFTATITSMERLTNTHWGNPRYRVSFNSHATTTTHADSAIAGVLTNREYHQGPVKVWLDARGNIENVEPVKGT